MPLSQMTLSQVLLPEYDQEMALTRKSIERAPEAKFGWKPHAKSGTLGWLCAFLAVLPSWVKGTLEKDSIDLAPKDGTSSAPPFPKTLREVLETFDKQVAEGRVALAAATDEQLDQPWRLLMGGKEIAKMSKYTVLRSMVINHMIHHRAQLGVYLRLLDVPVPAVYGPTADENPWKG